jgi:hypothetical protein
MKKLKLAVEALEVTSFTAEEERGGTGTVNGLQTGYTDCRPSYYETQCLCTRDEGCYPSLYCTQGGPYQLTCAADCMTNANGYC